MIDVLIIGAGPCGLACALEAQRAKLSYLLVDKGNVAEAIRRYPVNMTFFSTSENIEIGGVPLISHGTRPTRPEALHYYQRLAEDFKLSVERFTEINRIEKTELGFIAYSQRKSFRARFLIVATGYYDLPKYLGVTGEELPHVSHYYDEAFKYAGTRCTVVGGANSAIEAALDLYRHGAQVSLVHQFDQLDSNVKYWIKPDAENRIKEGAIKAYFSSRLESITSQVVNIITPEGSRSLETDFVFLMTGYRPDAEFLKQSGIKLHGEALIPEINTATYESNIPDLFLAGSIIGGEETAKVFIENGRLHAQPIITTIKARL